MDKPRWRYRCLIKDLISDDDSDAHAVLIGKEIARRLELKLKRVFAKHGGTEQDILEELIDEFNDIDTLDGFNYTLASLYDWADENDVWLGACDQCPAYGKPLADVLLEA